MLRVLVVLQFMCASLLAGGLEFEDYHLEYRPSASELDASFEFDFYNSSDRPIEIISLRAGCSCTGLEISSNLVQPGEKGVLMALVDLSGKLGKTVSATIEIRTNEESDAFYSLGYKVFSQGSVDLDKRLLRWSAGEEGAKRIRIKFSSSDGTSDWAVSGLECSNRDFDLSYEKDEEPGVYWVVVSPKPGVESSSAKVRVNTLPESLESSIPSIVLFKSG